MHHNITDETRRRLALSLGTRTYHLARRRPRRGETPYLGWLLLCAILLGIAVLAATSQP